MKKLLLLAVIVFMVAAGSTSALEDPDLVFYFSYDNPIEGDTVMDESDKGHNIFAASFQQRLSATKNCR